MEVPYLGRISFEIYVEPNRGQYNFPCGFFFGEIEMKGFTIFIVTFLGLAIYFFKINSFISLVCLLILLGGLYGSGKIG